MNNPWLSWWTDAAPLALQPTFPRLTAALILGALIGIERQWRQRVAGLRTNTLVCFGAAAFVDLASTLAGPNSTSVIAYVVSGVGFLGAGAIIKDGASIRGLNTAATLWCSAAVGACAGAGEIVDAVFVTFLLITINLVLRPLSRFIDRRAVKIDTVTTVAVSARCPRVHEDAARALCLRTIAERPLLLRQLRSESEDDDEEVTLCMEMEAQSRKAPEIEELVRILRSDEQISQVILREGASESE